MTAAEQLMERGGERERRGMLLNQLRRRFGELPDAVVARVGAASMADLYAWSMSLLTAPGLDEVFAGN